MALKDLKKAFSEEMTEGAVPSVGFVSSGLLSFDIITGGGLPVGRVIELSGPESVGKTSLTLHLCKTILDSGRSVLYLDLEQTLVDAQMTRAGIPPDHPNFYHATPACGEKAIDIFLMAIDEGEVGLAVIDSVPFLLPEAVVESEVGKANIAPVSRLISPLLTKITAACSSSGVTLLMINQVRSKIGGYGGMSTPGGSMLKHLFSYRAQLRRVSPSAEGIQTVIKIIKNKVGSAYQECSLYLSSSPDEAIDPILDLVNTLSELGVIKKSGSWFGIPKETAELLGLECAGKSVSMGQGLIKASNYIKERPELIEPLYKLGMESNSERFSELFK